MYILYIIRQAELMCRLSILLPCIAVLLLSCSPDLPDDVKAAYDKLPKNLDYNIHVKPANAIKKNKENP